MIQANENCHCCWESKSDTNLATALSARRSIRLFLQAEEIKQISPACSDGSAPLLCLLEPIFPQPLSLLLFHLLLLTSNNYLSLLPLRLIPVSRVRHLSLLLLHPFLHLGHKCLSGDDILRITGNGNWKRRTDAQAMSVALDSMRVFNLFCLRKWPRFETRSLLSHPLSQSLETNRFCSRGSVICRKQGNGGREPTIRNSVGFRLFVDAKLKVYICPHHRLRSPL